MRPVMVRLEVRSEASSLRLSNLKQCDSSIVADCRGVHPTPGPCGRTAARGRDFGRAASVVWPGMLDSARAAQWAPS
jgi:hypothetical protein